MSRLILIIFFIGIYSVKSQTILMNEGINADGLWCFPVLDQPNTYKYLPLEAHLALHENGLPQFSYMRYILEKPTENSMNSISDADGGGILHFLVLYDTPSSKVLEAESFLKKLNQNDSIKIKGPIVFDKGRYTLVSSILTSESAKKETKIIATGEAPILENSKLAFSFNVDPIKSKLLLESLKMTTPDVSLIFELGFSGLSDSYKATLDIDWSEVNTSNQFKAGGSVYFIGADVATGFDKFRRDNVIKFNSVGTDANMESLVESVYNKLLELMFKKVPVEEVPAGSRGGIEDAIGALIGQNGMLNSRNSTGFGLNVAYQYKEHHATGQSHLEFNGRSKVERNHFIAFNMGDVYQKYGKNQSVFKDIPLWDPAFQQRDVYLSIDGTLENEFSKMINSVTVRMRKIHQDSTVTQKEILLKKDNFKEVAQAHFNYLNHQDLDTKEWLNYEYQTVWKFVGGAGYQSEWIPESAAMINLYTPFMYKKIELMGDLEALKEKKIKAISVQISYDFFGEKRNASKTIYLSDHLEDKSFEITLPKGFENVNYTITWFRNNEKALQKVGVDSFGLLFIDELPNE